MLVTLVPNHVLSVNGKFCTIVDLQATHDLFSDEDPRIEHSWRKCIEA